MMENENSSLPESQPSPKKRGRPRKSKAEDAELVVSVYNDMLLDLVQKDYVLFAPKSTRGLKLDYPELDDKERYPEFASLRQYDMLFVWAWACASSPFVNIAPHEEKLRLCCKYAYPVDRWEAKAREYALRFPEENGMVRAMQRMEHFSLGARVEEYVALRIARENYKMILAKDISLAPMYQQKEWADLSIIATKGLAQQRERAEGFGLGIEEAQNTLIQQAVDLLSMHHNRN